VLITKNIKKSPEKKPEGGWHKNLVYPKHFYIFAFPIEELIQQA